MRSAVPLPQDPSDLAFGVVNHDAGGNYSDTFVHSLAVEGLDVRLYDSDDAALQAARRNDVWGYAIVPVNYTQNVNALLTFPPGPYTSRLHRAVLHRRQQPAGRRLCHQGRHRRL